MLQPLAPKQLEFVSKCTARWNIAHGPVSSGKTIGTLFAFMHAVDQCPDSQIWMIGHTSSTIYDNAIRLLLEERAPGLPDPLAIFRPFCTWRKGERELLFKDKTISTTGAKDSGAIGAIQGKTMSLSYCDEMTLYPEAIIDMIDTRLRNPHSRGFASMNPSHPTHKLKQWIDKANSGDPEYFQMQFMLEDNPYLDESYKNRIRNSLSGLFYKRNYLGLWCLAEGAIFDFFDKTIHTASRPPFAAEYFLVGIDYGTVNPFACLIIGVNTGRLSQTGKHLWVEKEYYWDSKKQGRQKTNSEYIKDVMNFIEGYPIKAVYIDPSAAAFKLELQRKGIHCVDGNNDVEMGIQYMASEMKEGNLVILNGCTNLIREVEGYVWDSKASDKGFDEPLKQADHACLTGDTIISLRSGNENIKQMAIIHYLNYMEESSPWLEMSEAYSGLINYNIESKSIVTDIFRNPSLTRKNAEIYELELEDGTVLKATGDHQVLTERGYIELQQLMLSDMVFTCNTNTTSEKSST